MILFRDFISVYHGSMKLIFKGKNNSYITYDIMFTNLYDFSFLDDFYIKEIKSETYSVSLYFRCDIYCLFKTILRNTLIKDKEELKNYLVSNGLYSYDIDYKDYEKILDSMF